MLKLKKFFAALVSCGLASAMMFAAACSGNGDTSTNSGSESGATESSNTEESSTAEESSVEESSVAEESSTEDSSGVEESSGDEESTGTEESGDDEEEDDEYTLSSTTVYFVGDSTVCEFSDSYYLPRYGYGTQFGNYVDSTYVTVKNLALSGRSSKSFISEDNYTTLTSSISEGDYLIIGFGHNDEKSDDAERYTAPTLNAAETEGTFQYYLYNYYIAVAIEKGATPILCTPIVRYNSSSNYTGSSGHVTSDGDYAACIRNLAENYSVTCVDLTTITTELYTTLGEEAQWFHAFTKAKHAEDGDETARSVALKGSETGETVSVVPDGMDSTHINMYGAKMISYQIATALQTARKTCNLGYYVLDNITEPTKANDLEAAYNSSYEYKPYSAPTLSSTGYSTVTDSVDGSTSYNLYKTVFGDVGGASKLSNYTFTNTDSVYTIDNSSSNNGKLSSSKDGLGAIFTQIDVSKTFAASVTVKLTAVGSGASNQSGFGLMLRDDMYIDTYDTAISTNYIAAGALDTSNSYAIFSKTDDSMTKKSAFGAMAAGDTYTVSISGGGQIFKVTVTDGTSTYTATYTDFSLTATDENYIYLCMFAARGIAVEFSDFTFAITGDAQSA
ncbi:MAG: GDSL-type esterase/lipase family protein [Clostridia bacterium]|nr:GDSL-type esterase/lipase family protein [Clostridia bacterium]